MIGTAALLNSVDEIIRDEDKIVELHDEQAKDFKCSRRLRNFQLRRLHRLHRCGGVIRQ